MFSDLSPDYLLRAGIVLAMMLLVAFPVHEFSHAFAAFRLGDNTARLMGRLTLDPIAHFDPTGVLSCYDSLGATDIFAVAGIGIGLLKAGSRLLKKDSKPDPYRYLTQLVASQDNFLRLPSRWASLLKYSCQQKAHQLSAEDCQRKSRPYWLCQVTAQALPSQASHHREAGYPRRHIPCACLQDRLGVAKSQQHRFLQGPDGVNPSGFIESVERADIRIETDNRDRYP